MGYQDHKIQSQKGAQRSVACAVVTCSDTRTHDDDESGMIIRTLLESNGHTHPFYSVTRDDPAQISTLLDQLAGRTDIQAIIFNGGTGVSRRDNTFDAVSSRLTKVLPGFGEIFRMLSYQEIGSGAILSRATAGIIVTPGDPGPRHTVVFSMPGSPHAVELAMTKLVIPELSHLVWETLR
jgi:molybdenum cofactor biosynthesis protein B